jgi:hypothetical protein
MIVSPSDTETVTGAFIVADMLVLEDALVDDCLVLS